MTYEVTMKKDFGNKKEFVAVVEAERKIDAFYKAKGKAVKADWHNWKHVQIWDITFSAKKIEEKA